MALHLFFLLLLVIILPDCLCGHTAAQEKTQMPEISVTAQKRTSGLFDIACQLENPSAVNITCNLYIGDSSDIYTRTWTKKHVCLFTVDASNLQRGREVSCDYRVNTEPPSLSPRSKKYSIVGKLPKAELELHPKVILLEQSVNLRCRRSDSSAVSHCIFTINEGVSLSGSDCERSVTGAELLSGRHRALNEITMRCSYGLEGRPSLPSDPSKLTVLDLRKPNISVSTEHSEARIHCEAPPDITGAYFGLYSNLNGDIIRGTQARKDERGVIFTVPRSSDSTQTYCCSYTFKNNNSKLSDCVRDKLPKPELKLHPAVIPKKESVNLRCRIPVSSPAPHCTFTINEGEPLSGSDCERSVTGAELLSGRHRALNEITMRCSYGLEGGEKPSLPSDPSTVTVLDLRKPRISVSTEHSETHIHCEAPPDIIGASFFLYFNMSRSYTKSAKAGKEERGVIFAVPSSSDSTLTYCCRYQVQRITSELSDCAEAENKDQSGTTADQSRFLWRHILSALVLLAAIGFLTEHIISHPPTTGRKRRGRENTGQFVETVC